MSRLLLLIAAPAVFLILWSAGFAIAKLGLQHAEPLTLLALRYGLALAILAPVALVLRVPLPATAREWADVAIVGFLIQVVYFGLCYIAFRAGVSAGGVAIVVCLQPILVALAAPGLVGETIGRHAWTGLALGLTGAATVILSRSEIAAGSGFGIACTVVALLGITAGTLWEKRFGVTHHPVASNLIQYAVGAAFTLPAAWALETMVIDWTPAFVAVMAYLVIGNSLLAMTLLLAMIRARQVSRVSSLFYLVPPLSALFAWPLLDEAMPPSPGSAWRWPRSAWPWPAAAPDSGPCPRPPPALSMQEQIVNLTPSRDPSCRMTPISAFPKTARPPDAVRTVALSEVFAETMADAGALGFVLSRLPPGPLLWIQDRLSRRETGRPCLAGLGHRTILMLDVPRPVDVLAAAEEGLRCKALAAVLAEIWGAPPALDFTATKRLAVRAETTGVPCWLLRHGGTADLSAARDRWRVRSLPSAPNPDDAQAPGDPRWHLTLFRSRHRPPGQWTAQHDRAQDRVHLAAALPDGALAETAGPTGQRSLG